MALHGNNYWYMHKSIMHTEIRFELGLTENQVNESTDLVQLNVIRSGQFNEIYSPSVEYGIATTGSSTARGIYIIMITIILLAIYLRVFILTRHNIYFSSSIYYSPYLVTQGVVSILGYRCSLYHDLQIPTVDKP